VVQVEQALEDEDTILISTGSEARLAAETADPLRRSKASLSSVPRWPAALPDGRCRTLRRRGPHVVERSASLAEAAVASPKAARSWRSRALHQPEDPDVPPLALVFPGQGAHYAGMGQALYDSFPVIREWMDRAAAAADFDLLHLLFHDREENLQKTRWQQPALFTVEHAMADTSSLLAFTRWRWPATVWAS